MNRRTIHRAFCNDANCIIGAVRGQVQGDARPSLGYEAGSNKISLRNAGKGRPHLLLQLKA